MNRARGNAGFYGTICARPFARSPAYNTRTRLWYFCNFLPTNNTYIPLLYISYFNYYYEIPQSSQQYTIVIIIIRELTLLKTKTTTKQKRKTSAAKNKLDNYISYIAVAPSLSPTLLSTPSLFLSLLTRQEIHTLTHSNTHTHTYTSLRTNTR